MTQLLIAPATQNKKLGKGVATSYRPVGDAAKGEGTCPSGCKFLPIAKGTPLPMLDNPDREGGCYTQKFLVDQQQNASRSREDHLDRFLLKGASFIRLHTSGDFFMPDGLGGYMLDREYLDMHIAWARKHSHVLIWTYTHDVRKLIEAGYSYVNGSFPENLHIVASCDTLADKAYAISHGYRTARVIHSPSEIMPDETFCPYDLFKYQNRKDKEVTCKQCTLCFNPKHLRNIAFLKQK